MKYHYIPKYDETVFNRIANKTTPILEERWKRRVCTDIVHHRTVILRELSDLRCKPRRTLEDDERMHDLEEEAKRLTMQIGTVGKASKEK
jgi:shikimate kinase